MLFTEKEKATIRIRFKNIVHVLAPPHSTQKSFQSIPKMISLFIISYLTFFATIRVGSVFSIVSSIQNRQDKYPLIWLDNEFWWRRIVWAFWCKENIEATKMWSIYLSPLTFTIFHAVHTLMHFLFFLPRKVRNFILCLWCSMPFWSPCFVSWQNLSLHVCTQGILVYSMFGLDSWMYTTRYCSSALCLKLSSSWTKISFYVELVYKLTFGCWITIAFCL